MIVLALAIVAAVLAAVSLVQSRGADLDGWAILALAVAALLASGVLKL